MTEVEWDQIPVANGEPHGLRGCRIHHRDGCKGRKDGAKSRGWHVRTGTADELARCAGLCDTCVKRMEARADG